MDNTKTDIGLIELVIIDVIFMAIFVLMLFIAAVCPADNLFAMNLPLVFGGVTLPFAPGLAKWLKYIRYHEGDKISSMLNTDQDTGKLLLWDFGLTGYTWMFRAMSGLMIIFSIYHFIN